MFPVLVLRFGGLCCHHIGAKELRRSYSHVRQNEQCDMGHSSFLHGDLEKSSNRFLRWR